MKAVILNEKGVALGEAPEPTPGPEQVLVRVKACGMNRADMMVASGTFHGAQGGPGTIIGMEWSGEVVEVGSKVTHVAPGDRVMCSGAGGWAELAVADRGRVARVPDANLSFEDAATLPIGLQTMHNAIVTAGAFRKGQSVLLQGASTGVGLIGLQIAKHLGAGLVIGTSTSPDKRARLPEFGADLVLDPTDEGWADAVLEATEGNGVDLIVDQVSGYTANDNLRATRILGRIVNVGRLGGNSGDFNFDLHALRRITYVGVTFRTRSVEEIREINELMRADLGDALSNGEIRIPIDRTFPISEVADALAHMRANAHFGKIVLRVAD